MTDEEKREHIICSLVSLLRTTPFSVEFKVVKKPKGIKIIHEVTQEEMDVLTKQVINKSNELCHTNKD